MTKRILILLFSISILCLSLKAQTGGSNEPASPTGNGSEGNDPDATEVPIDDYVPFLVAGIIVYGVWMNRQKKTVLAFNQI